MPCLKLLCSCGLLPSTVLGEMHYAHSTGSSVELPRHPRCQPIPAQCPDLGIPTKTPGTLIQSGGRASSSSRTPCQVLWTFPGRTAFFAHRGLVDSWSMWILWFIQCFHAQVISCSACVHPPPFAHWMTCSHWSVQMRCADSVSIILANLSAPVFFFSNSPFKEIDGTASRTPYVRSSLSPHFASIVSSASFHTISHPRA